MLRLPRFFVAIAFAAPILAGPSIASAQNVVIGTPFNNVGDSFYESYGASGSWSNGNAFFNWGGGGAVPPFGGYDPNGDARFGFNVGGLNLGFTASQGSSRFSSSQTPMVTVPNGGYGSFFNGTVTPFVTGFVPVVGADGAIYGGGTTMLEDRWSRLQAGERPTPLKPEPQDFRQASFADSIGEAEKPLTSLPSSRSSAEVATAGVAAQRAAYLAEASRESLVENERFQQALERAEAALADGKSKLAKAYLDQAVRYATDDEQRREARARLQEVSAGTR